MISIKDIKYGDSEFTKLDIHLPENKEFPVFIYFHGGGLEGGDKRLETAMHNTLTSNGIAVVTANYRMYPHAKYPEFIEDCAEACAWVKKHIGEYGTPSGIYIGGSSAGGYLSMMLCMDCRWLSKHGLSPLDFDGFVHDAGQPTCHFNVLRERGIDTRRVIVDDSCPLYHISTDSAYPKMLIIVSDNDMENRIEQTQLFVSTLKHFRHSNYELKIMHGKHCEYVYKCDSDGVSIFGKLISDFING